MQAERQSTVLHESLPEHVIAHREPLKQSMLLHALSPMQLIVQSQPDGQVTFPQLSLDEHSTRHVRASSSHEVQSFGQFGTTQ